jgi:hypothetical protein
MAPSSSSSPSSSPGIMKKEISNQLLWNPKSENIQKVQ